MSRERLTKNWSVRSIDKTLELLDFMEADDFVPYTWESPVHMENGVKHYQLTFPHYHPAVGRLYEALKGIASYEEAYAQLPEDSAQECEPFSALNIDHSPEFFATATVNQIRRYIHLCSRGERFCDGHIASQFDDGRMLAALRRLRELRQDMRPRPKKAHKPVEQEYPACPYRGPWQT